MTPDTVEFRTAMRGLRRRRWFLWGLILVYIPVIWTSLALTRSDRSTGLVFAVWLLLVCRITSYNVCYTKLLRG